MRFSRGGAVPETAIMLGVILTLLFGTFELGIIGLQQLGGDGAAFVAARASVLGNDPNAAVAGPFPMIAQNADITVKKGQPENTDMPVDFQIDQTTNRHGGVQVVRPSHTQATITNNGVGLGGILPKSTLSSAFIEPNMMVSGVGFGIFGTPINSAADFGNGKSYFDDDGNAPPYFIGLRYLYHCFPTNLQGCQQSASMYAVGLAEYLDGTNWNQPQNGIGPGGVYESMSIHQQVYAAIAQRLATQAYPGGLGDGTVLDPKQPCLQTVHNWDISIPAGYPLGSTKRGTYPLHPLWNTPGCS